MDLAARAKNGRSKLVTSVSATGMTPAPQVVSRAAYKGWPFEPW